MRMDHIDNDSVLSYYEGFMNEQNHKHGFGRLVLPSGDQKVGFWYENEPRGNFYEISYDNIVSGKIANRNWRRYFYDEDGAHVPVIRNTHAEYNDKT